jgi:hypothetical protein
MDVFCFSALLLQKIAARTSQLDEAELFIDSPPNQKNIPDHYSREYFQCVISA